MSDESPRYLWMNGEIVPWDRAMIHVSNLTIRLASSVFEGIRAYWNAEQHQLYVFRLDDHLKRLMQSIAFVRMESRFGQADLTESVLATIRANEAHHDTYIFPLAYYGAGPFGWMGGAPTNLVITVAPTRSMLRSDEAVACGVSSWTRISDNVLPPRVKCFANYQNSALAAAEAARNGYHPHWGAILLNAQGKVSEGAGACLMLVRDGTLITSPVTSGILDSVTRRSLIQIARDIIGVDVVEREVDRTELYSADEVFLCGTGAEVTPVGSIDHYQVGSGAIGPVTRRMRDAYHDLVRGIDARYAGWRTGVY